MEEIDEIVEKNEKWLASFTYGDTPSDFFPCTNKRRWIPKHHKIKYLETEISFFYHNFIIFVAIHSLLYHSAFLPTVQSLSKPAAEPAVARRSASRHSCI